MLLADNLAIFIITYNRAHLLKETLLSLSNSKFAECEVVVLDNCSNDETLDVCNSFFKELPLLKIDRSNLNIGAGANVMRAFSISQKPYTWVLCDDDIYDFAKIDDVIEIIGVGEADLIHVGGHPDLIRYGMGMCSIPADLRLKGYQYFKLASFLPANIFRTKLLKKYIRESYNYIYFMYPHMPVIIGVYQNNCLVYVSNKCLVTATLGTQDYDCNTLFIKWIGMAKEYGEIKIAEMLITDQFKYEDDELWRSRLLFNSIRFRKVDFIIVIFQIFDFGWLIKDILVLIKKSWIKLFNFSH